ncbi:hypothetical protein [uncultured Dokdonia sp.]|uniref:hypothetical protein n=1 Tax=uncultured Dokdonia sp. TaxID=575653 RepID=UPI00260F3F5C|nr:hypothetical protein [uncultured Dokdonia sp.]
MKKQRSTTLTDVHTIEKYSIENYDILMQPKTINHDGSALFGEFSLRNMYKVLLLLVTIILVILSLKYGFIPY